MKKQALLITCVLFATLICHGAVIRVPADQPTIQAGIDAAAQGETNGLRFWAGICRPVTYDVISEIDHVEFGYR